MPLGSDYEGQDCALARALEVVGERWTLLVLRDCLFGVRRFSDLLAHLDISRAVLAARLADLVDAGLLERHEYRPGRTTTASRRRARSCGPPCTR
jgi:DNA-binding HxlR family transcriptional regulator